MGDSLPGSLITVPFATGALRTVVVEQYRALLAEYDSEDILVLTGSPTSMATVQDLLADEVPGAAVPWVSSLVVHATDVVNQTDERAILSDALRRELIHRFVDEYNWDTDYLQRAAAQPSFPKDIAQVMETATWQQQPFKVTAELVEVASALDAFHEWLAEHDHMERGQLVAEAATVLTDGAARDEAVDAKAVLAVEFEEFFPLDRQYLTALAEGLDLVCVAETDASIRRTRLETGPITEQTSFSSAQEQTDGQPTTRPGAAAAYWARGDVPEDPGDGAVNVLAAQTADEQLERVADEIERLREEYGWSYDEFAVATQHSGSTLTDTLHALEQAGLPTEPSTVVGFGDDPAVRELLQVVRYLAADEPARTELLAEFGNLDESILDAVEKMSGLNEPLRCWATESGLKSRIADGTDPLDARSQFGNIKRVFRMASFVEDTGFLEASWGSFATMLERAHEYSPQRNQTSSTERNGGVRVDHMEALKNGRFRAVFLLDLVDEEYPGDPWLTRLFPQERVSQMPDFPAVTQVTDTEVESTFATDSTASSRPFRRYYAEQSRRRLAVGAAAATDRLYCCSYEYEDTALEERAQPSRFLTGAYRALPWLTETSAGAIRSEQAAEEYLLSRVDRALADVRRSQSQDVTVSLDDLESDLAEVQTLLENSGDRGEELRRALRARVDFAEGCIRRE